MFTAALDELSTLSETGGDALVGLSRSELEGRVAATRRIVSAAEAHLADLMVAINALDDNGLDGAGVLRARGGVSSKQAMRAAKTAATLAQMPDTKAALAAGRITAEHADAVADAAAKTSPDVADALIGNRAPEAPIEPADVFAKRAREHANRHTTTPDDGLAKHERQHRNRTAMITTDDASGMGIFRFELDPTAAARTRQELEHLATRMWHDDGGRDADLRTARTRDQRLADAFVELVTGPKADACSSRHPKSQLNINIDIAALTMDDGTPLATLVADGTPLPAAVKDRLACVSGFSVTLFDGPSRPIWVGRDHRHATIAQWRALIARDRGCIGCGATPDRCEAHHILHWDDFGPTDIDNLVLVCKRCHHDLHDRGQILVREPGGRWMVRPPELRLPKPGSSRARPDRAKPHNPRSRQQVLTS